MRKLALVAAQRTSVSQHEFTGGAEERVHTSVLQCGATGTEKDRVP